MLPEPPYAIDEDGEYEGINPVDLWFDDLDEAKCDEQDAKYADLLPNPA